MTAILAFLLSLTIQPVPMEGAIEEPTLGHKISREGGYRTWNGGDCKGLVKGNDSYCKTGDCKALVKGNDS